MPNKRRSNVEKDELDKLPPVAITEPIGSQELTHSRWQGISAPIALSDQPSRLSSLGGDVYQHGTSSRAHAKQPLLKKRHNIKGTVVELEGEQKSLLAQGYFEDLRCPSCIVSNQTQTLKYHGIPWVDWGKNYRNCDLYEGLSAELEDFFNFIRPNEEDEILRKATFYSIAKSIKRCKKVDAVKFYGSYSSNTYLPVSDIDMVIITDQEHPIVAILVEVANLLFQDGIIEKECSVIPHSRIPLLKFYDCLTGLQINITVNTPNVMERADYIRDNFRKSTYELKILYFMKYYLLSKGSNQVYLGGIGSYALSLMVIRYFQEPETKDLIRQYREANSTLLARLLIGFLKRYSDVEFIRSCRISVRGEGEYIAEPAHDSFCSGFYKKTSILRIEDHIEPWKNVSAGSFNSDLILEGFGLLLKSLLNPEQCDNNIPASIIGNALVVVDSFVEFRSILTKIFKIWFTPHAKRAHPSEKYEKFISQRNVFGPRNIKFDYNRFDDNTAQIVLKDTLESDMQSYQRNCDNNNYGGPCSSATDPVGGENYAYNGPTYTSSMYHFPDHFDDVHLMHSALVRQRYPKESQAKQQTEEEDLED